jgi:hypothetical protein
MSEEKRIKKQKFIKEHIEGHNTYKKQWIAFISIGCFFAVLMILLGIQSITKDGFLVSYGKNLIQAVYRDQVVTDNSVKTGLVKIRSIQPEDILVGNEVLVYDEARDSGRYLWVQEIVLIQGDQITVRFNDFLISQTVSYDDIVYAYVRDATQTDKVFYFITQPRGLLYAFVVSFVFVSASYIIIIKKRD